MDDDQIIDRCRNGDREAFSELVHKYSRPLTMLVLRMIRDPEEAKDISQQAFLKAYEGLNAFAGNSSFKTWLYSIAVNATRDVLRKKRHISECDSPDELNDPQASPYESLKLKREHMKLRCALEALPEKQRTTVQLRIYEGMDYKEIADLVGGSAGSARVNFFQGVQTLKRKLGEEP